MKCIALTMFAVAVSLMTGCKEQLHQTNVDTSAIMKLNLPEHVNSIDEIYDIKVLSKFDSNKKTRVQALFPGMNPNVLNYGCIEVYPNSESALSDFRFLTRSGIHFPISTNNSKINGKDNLYAVSLGERMKDEFGFYTGDRYLRNIAIKKSNVLIKLIEYAPEPSNLQKVIDSIAEIMGKRLAQKANDKPPAVQ